MRICSRIASSISAPAIACSSSIGSGYGAALGAQIVGPHGRVVTVEIDAELASRAKDLLSPLPNVTALHGDATRAAAFFCRVQQSRRRVRGERAAARLARCAPARRRPRRPRGTTTQHLLRVERMRDGRLEVTRHGAVRYVPNRSQ